MTPGQLARRVLGDRWFPMVGRWYRASFVDLDVVAQTIPPLPAGARVLDIGGGDGELMNSFLARHRDARVTMIDLAPRLGTALRSEFRSQVEILPATSVRDYLALRRPPPDLVMIADVVHHIPVDQRPQFFADVADVIAGTGAALFIKEVSPGTLRARWAYFADRYISGDRNVSFLPERELIALVSAKLPGARPTSTDLYQRDSPNYSVVFAPG